MSNWDDYRYFLAVAESGSLSAAARRLGVAQPTVGRRIQALEDQLRARLFERLSHGYELTAMGENILALAQRMEQESFAIERRVAGADAQLAGRVCISTAEGLAVYWLAGKLAKLRADLPELEIELLIGISMVDLLRREADIALRVGSPGSDELVGRRVAKVRFGLYAAVAYIATHGEPRSVDELAKHTIIESVRETGNLMQARMLRESAQSADIALRCNHLITQLQAARTGLGIIALPVYMVAGAPELQRILRAEFDPQLDVWLLTHRDLRQTARVRAVLDFIAKELHADQTMLTG